MKKIIFILIILLLSSCGSRKKEMEKQTEKIQIEENTNLQQNQSFENKTQSVTDLSKFLSDKGLKITSTGQPYQLKYGDMVFSGSADVELTEKKEETKLYHKYFNHISYQTHIAYKTHTTYKSILIDKKLKVEREAYSFWVYILIGFLGSFLLKFLWKKLKQSTWQLKIWNN